MDKKDFYDVRTLAAVLRYDGRRLICGVNVSPSSATPRFRSSRSCFARSAAAWPCGIALHGMTVSKK